MYESSVSAMTQLQQTSGLLGQQTQPERAGGALARVGIDAGIVLLALIAADSIYHLPMSIRLLLLAVGPIAVAVEAARAFSRTAATRRDSAEAHRVGNGRRGAAKGKSFIHRGVVGGLLLLFFVGAVAVRPAYFGRELVRVFMPWHDYRSSAEAQLEHQQHQREEEQQRLGDATENSSSVPVELKVEPGNTEIQRGDSLRIVVSPSRTMVPVMAPVTLRYRGADGRWVIKPMPEDPAQPEKFSDFLRDVGEDLAYQVVMGSAASPVYNVRVYDVAGLKAIRLSYKYPPAAGLTDRIVTSADGTIEAVAGTRVEVTLLATGPLRSSSLQLNGEPALPMDVRGPEASRVIQVLSDGNYAMTALDAKGTPLDLPWSFAIRAIQRSGPKIEAGKRGVESGLPPME